MKWKTILAGYFTFSRRERIGLLLLTTLILFIFLLPAVIRERDSQPPAPADTAWISAAKKLELAETKKGRYEGDDNEPSYHYDRSVTNSNPSASLFYFDPNTLNAAGWQSLGLKDKTIQTIRNYLDKGGHFYTPADLKRIYGLHINDYMRLEPWIRIETSNPIDKPVIYARKETEPKRFSYHVIDINTADTTAFISLPGIGSKLAARIVNFRNKLGGFYSIDQVGETYGLPDSSFQKIKQYLKLENMFIKKININTATPDELKAHPYIRYSVANPIIAYRNEHGPFSSIEDLKKVMMVTDEVYNKILPYLTN